MSRLFLLSVLFLFSGISIFSQSNTAIGEWKSYLPLKNSKHYAYGNGKIFAATTSGLIIIENEDLSAEFYTKISGLQGVGLELIEYDPVRDQVIIVYDNSLIELFSSEESFAIKDIELNSNIQGSKKINQLHIDNQAQFCYFSTSFGVVQYNLERKEFGFTSFSEQEIFHTITYGNLLITATDQGAYYFDLTSNLNPSDFNSWKLLGTNNNLPKVYQSTFLQLVNNELYLVVDEFIYKAGDDLQFENVYEYDGLFTVKDLEEINSGWALTLKDEEGQGEIHFLNEDNELIVNNMDCPNKPNNIIQDENGRIWLSDDWDRIRYLESVEQPCKFIDYNAPQSSSASDLSIKDNTLYVASGGVSDVFGYLGSRDGFYIFGDNKWRNLNQFNYAPIADNDFQNVFRIKPHPNKDLLYAGSYWAGLIEYNLIDGSHRFFNKDNSSLQGATGDESRTRISGLTFDRQNNLWISNFAADKPLSVLTNEGNWFSFDVISNGSLADIVIDPSGLLWIMVAGNSGGVLVYDVGENIQDPTDDRQRFFNANNSELPTNVIKSIASDVEGDIWVGTADGITIFECGSGAFDEGCIGNRPTFTVLSDSVDGYLLDDEVVQSILVDGANRKWLGTKNGLFLQSPDGEQELNHFTEVNSPLVSNEILDLAYNEVNGEVFIATTKGILSYRSASTGANRTHQSEVYAYPNPVHPDYTGTIAIKGLARDANVKITSLNGNLVHETTALGGQAVWDGNLYDGTKASAGVYLVFSSTTDIFFDPNSYVTKILLVR